MILLRPVLEVDRDERELRLWLPRLRRYSIKRRWPITVGMLGHETPTGVYSVEWKTRTPDWRAPDADWVLPPERRGKVFPFGSPGNPFAGGFISFSKLDGVGFHGVNFDPKLGTASSHGCVRMDVADLDELWPRAKTGTLVFVY